MLKNEFPVRQMLRVSGLTHIFLHHKLGQRCHEPHHIRRLPGELPDCHQRAPSASEGEESLTDIDAQGDDDSVYLVDGVYFLNSCIFPRYIKFNT